VATLERFAKSPADFLVLWRAADAPMRSRWSRRRWKSTTNGEELVAIQRSIGLAALLAALSGAVLLGCGADGGGGGGGIGGSAASAGAAGSAGTAGGGTGGSSGSGGDSGSGGSGGIAGAAGAGGTGGEPGGGSSAMATVSGGSVMSSANYRLILTSGEGPGGNGVMTSPSYRLNGGLVGATQ
jgi:hypothetical protein